MKKEVIYPSIYDHIEDADLTYIYIEKEYEGEEIVEGIRIADDPEYHVFPEEKEIDGEEYIRVSYGEEHISYIPRKNLWDVVYVVCIWDGEKEKYRVSSGPYRTREEAEKEIQI